MVSLHTRVYATDRSVVAKDSDSVPDRPPEVPDLECRPAADIAQCNGSSGNGGHPVKDDESLAAPSGSSGNGGYPVKDVKSLAAPSVKESVSWVLSSSAEMEGDQVKAQVTVKEGVNGSDLSLDVAACVLRVAHGKEVLEIALPVAVDSAAVPAAKWSKKTRTLTTRLEIQRG